MSFMLTQNISKRSFSFNDYLSRGYSGRIQSLDLSQDMHTTLELIGSKNLGSMAEFRLSQRIFTEFDPLGKNTHLYNAREYTPGLIGRNNVILIGSQIGNPWNELFDRQLNFVVRTDSNSVTRVVNRVPAAGEQQTYTEDPSSWGYCIVAYLPIPDHTGRALLIEGAGSESTESAGNFILSEDQLSNFQKMLHVTKLPYFEVLLKVAWVRGTPLNATIVAYRIYPNLH
jgi:hypothetical protein